MLENASRHGFAINREEEIALTAFGDAFVRAARPGLLEEHPESGSLRLGAYNRTVTFHERRSRNIAGKLGVDSFEELRHWPGFPADSLGMSVEVQVTESATAPALPATPPAGRCA